MSRSCRVLFIEDDEAVRNAIAFELRSAGYTVRDEVDGNELEEISDSFRPDIALLDVMLPGRSGFELAQQLRNKNDLPILFLTARDTVSSRLAGFSAGADDYVIKPVAVEELLARLRALLRRSGRLDTEVLEVGDLILDESARLVRRGDVTVELTPIEFQLLAFLMRNRGVVLSRLQIMSQVWGYEEHDPNLVPVHMGNLRRKLEAVGPRLIQTIRGHGYVLRV
ncbi:MAG TPA: response regulator transcription factor [Gaiellaceae bacterium]